MRLYSYHVFIFPFQWEINSESPFDERFKLSSIEGVKGGNWENVYKPKNQGYETELFNEKNFFYKFVHNALYDSGPKENAIIRHFERKEAYLGSLEYEIAIKAGIDKVYKLKLKSIGLDLFSTGTGMLVFYLENHNYKQFHEIRTINQFGRRVFPPFLSQESGVDATKGSELADRIAIYGLLGDASRYTDDFKSFGIDDYWKPARFIRNLITDLNPNLQISPVIDDRMFTMCWYFNNALSEKIKNPIEYYRFVRSDEWHQYTYVDSSTSTCQNDRMQKKLLEEHTYPRWQKYGTLYGITRYSFMAISDEGWIAQNVLLTYFRSMYVRIVELALVQRASVLKFSAEVTRLSSLNRSDQKLAKMIDSFYKQYIRFVNQIYFREITSQEQGIELYDKLTESMRLKEQVKDLDDEIEELHKYATLLDDKIQNQLLGLLTIIGSLFLVPTFITGYFGMNLISIDEKNIPPLLVIVLINIFVVAVGLLWVVKSLQSGNRKRAWWIIALIVGFTIVVMSSPYFLNSNC